MQIQLLQDIEFNFFCEGFSSLSSIYKMQVLFLWFLMLMAMGWLRGLTVARNVPMVASSLKFLSGNFGSQTMHNSVWGGEVGLRTSHFRFNSGLVLDWDRHS